jgi:hypothetical protein
MNEDRITWKVININLKGKCLTGRPSTRYKQQIIKAVIQKQGRNNTRAE